MTDPVYTPMPRQDVVSYLGRALPPHGGDPFLTVPPDSGLTDGGVSVHPIEGRPGTTWWVVDSTIYRQDAGTPDEALAALLPGSVLGTIPQPPDPETPPQS